MSSLMKPLSTPNEYRRSTFLISSSVRFSGFKFKQNLCDLCIGSQARIFCICMYVLAFSNSILPLYIGRALSFKSIFFNASCQISKSLSKSFINVFPDFVIYNYLIIFIYLVENHYSSLSIEYSSNANVKLCTTSPGAFTSNDISLKTLIQVFENLNYIIFFL